MDFDLLRKTFVYEPEGTLRKVLGARKPYPWRAAGSGGRYLLGHFDGKAEYLHRLVWMFHHGRVPAQVDHIDGDTRNNRIENLRECTSAQNQFNSRRKVNNRSGVKGVVRHEKCTGKPWHAKINAAGRRISLGYHATKEEAARAYAAGAAIHAGEFARPDARKD